MAILNYPLCTDIAFTFLSSGLSFDLDSRGRSCRLGWGSCFPEFVIQSRLGQDLLNSLAGLSTEYCGQYWSGMHYIPDVHVCTTNSMYLPYIRTSGLVRGCPPHDRNLVLTSIDMINYCGPRPYKYIAPDMREIAVQPTTSGHIIEPPTPLRSRPSSLLI